VRKELTRRLSLFLLVSIAISIAGLTCAVQAQTLPLVYVDPEENVADPGETFTININVQDVEFMYSYGIKIGFNRFVLAVDSVTEGPFLSSMVPTAFVYRDFGDYVDVGCSTLGSSDGVSGSGTLFNVTFTVLDAGTSELDMFSSTLLDPTLSVIPHESAGGYFYTTAKANVVRRSAWPEHRHFDVNKDEDFDGTYANQALNARVRNLGPTDLYVYATFEIFRDDGLIATVATGTVLIMPGEIVDLTGNFEVSAADAGKYAAAATAHYSWTGTYFTQGDKVKTFSFAVVP
jgi:hypothetical protein